MAEKCIKRPRDPVQLAKLIGDIATGQLVDKVEDGKDAAVIGRFSAKIKPVTGRRVTRYGHRLPQRRKVMKAAAALV